MVNIVVIFTIMFLSALIADKVAPSAKEFVRKFEIEMKNAEEASKVKT